MALADVSTGMVLVLVVLVALPIGAIVFARGAGDAFDQIGKGDLSIGDDRPAPDSGPALMPISSEVREEEIRQMVQARSDRAVDRGGEGFDVGAEVDRLLGADSEGPGLEADAGLREEVRQLVVARNERRVRQGKEPLDVDAEVARQLRELENLGQ